MSGTPLRSAPLQPINLALQLIDGNLNFSFTRDSIPAPIADNISALGTRLTHRGLTMVFGQEGSGNLAEATEHPSIVSHYAILVKHIREIRLHIVRDSSNPGTILSLSVTNLMLAP